jgi:hypothetical protein
MSFHHPRPVLDRRDNWVVLWGGQEIRFHEDKAAARRFHATLYEVVATANEAIDDPAWAEKHPVIGRKP